MKRSIFLALMLFVAPAFAGTPYQPAPGQVVTVNETYAPWPRDMNIHAEQVGDNVRVYIDPIDYDDIPAPNSSWIANRRFVLTIDGQVAWVDHFCRMGPPPTPHFGTDDELFMDYWMDQGRADAEEPHEYKVYFHSNGAPDFDGVNSSVLDVWTNTMPGVTVSLDLIDFEIEMPSVILPDDSTPVSVPLTVTPDQACELTGGSLSFKFESERMDFLGASANASAGMPSFVSLQAINEPTQYPNFPGITFPGGFAYFGLVFDYMLIDTVPVSPGVPYTFATFSLAAKPGASTGPVDFDLWNYGVDCDLVPNFGCAANNVIVYRDLSLGPDARDYNPSALGPFPFWTAPSVVIADLSTATLTSGDCNSSGSRDMSDVIGILNYLFLGGSVSCLSAVDVDRNGQLNITDPTALLTHLFLGGSIAAECSEYTGQLTCDINVCP